MENMGGEYRTCCILHSHMLLLLFNLLLLQRLCCTTIDNITLATHLSQEQVLSSPSKIFALGFFQPTNSSDQYLGIWYENIAPRTVVWVANREKPVTDTFITLMIGSDGNLKLVDRNRDTLWSTNVTVSSNNSVAVLSNDGNLALKDSVSGDYLWQSFEHPSETFLLGSSIGFDAKTGERRVMTSWKSDTDPSPGNFVVGLVQQSSLQVFIWNGSVPYWRSGQWDKTKFIGIQQRDSSYSSIFELREDTDGSVYLSSSPHNQTDLEKMVISPEGHLMLAYWEDKRWKVEWKAPNSPCDVYGTCGPFGVCKASESTICSCLKGFLPKSDDEWSKGNWTGGCVIRTELLCEANTSDEATDRFWKMERMKLPDFSEYQNVDYPFDCEHICLNNCSCKGYATVDGIGCLIWTENLIDMQEFSFGGEAFFLRLASTEFAHGRLREKLIISLSTIFCVIVIILGIFIYGLHRKRSRKISKTSLSHCEKLSN
ncbi:hypothetical protein DITRI_Ditri02bG0022300 [Diplodiscus trichospermus]